MSKRKEFFNEFKSWYHYKKTKPSRVNLDRAIHISNYLTKAFPELGSKSTGFKVDFIMNLYELRLSKNPNYVKFIDIAHDDESDDDLEFHI